jgi:ubiquinone/menaquinone biosynthesis C-methylase UbiE
MFGSSQRAGLDRREALALYDRLAPYYGKWTRFTEGRALRLALQVADVEGDERVLDVGLGTGTNLQAVARQLQAGHAVGVDVSPAMLQRAKTILAELASRRWSLARADALALPFASEAFDLVFSSYLLDLLPGEDFPGILGEFRRVLKPQGRLVLVGMALPLRPWHGVFEALYRLSPRLMGGCRGIALAPYVREAGFVDVQRAYVTQMGFPSEVVWARKWVGL